MVLDRCTIGGEANRIYTGRTGEISARIQIHSRVPSICIPALAGRSPRKVSNSRSAGMPRISTCLEDSEFAHARRFHSRGRARSTRRPPADGSNWNISDLTTFTSNISLIAKSMRRSEIPVREFYKLSA